MGYFISMEDYKKRKKQDEADNAAAFTQQFNNYKTNQAIQESPYFRKIELPKLLQIQPQEPSQLPNLDYSSSENFLNSLGNRFNYTPNQAAINEQTGLDRWTSQTGEKMKENLYNNLLSVGLRKLGAPIPEYNDPGLDYNTGTIGNVTSDLAGMLVDPTTYIGGAIGKGIGGAVKGAKFLSNAGKFTKFAVPAAAEGATFAGLTTGMNEARDYMNEPYLLNSGNLETSIGNTLSSAVQGAGLGIGLGALGKLYGKFRGVNAPEVPPQPSPIDINAPNIPKRPILQPYGTPGPQSNYQGNFTVSMNKVKQQAEQDLNDAIEAVQNHFGTNKLTEEEVARIQPELGINFEEIFNRIENPQVNIRDIGERSRLGHVANVNNIMFNDKGGLYNLKYPRNLVPNPRPLQNPINPNANILNTDKNRLSDIIKDIQNNKSQNINIPPTEPPISPNTNPSTTEDIIKNMERNFNNRNQTAIPTSGENIPQGINTEFAQDITPGSNLKPSQFRTNTLERYTKITPEEKAQLTPENYHYIKETNKEWQDTAAANVEKDIHEVMNRLYNQPSLTGGTDAAEGALVGEKLLQRARTTGNELDMNAYKNWTELMAERTRKTARGLKSTDLSYDKSTPAGAVQKAQSVIDSSISDNAHKQINAEARTLKARIDKINSQGLDSIANQMGGDVGKLINEFNNQKVVSDITEYLTQKGNLTEQEAMSLGNTIKQQLKQITAPKKTQILNSMFKEKTKSIPKTDFDKTMDLINLGAYDNTTIKNLIKKREGLPVLENEDIQKIVQHMENAQKIPDKSSYEYRAEVARASDVMADKLPATWRDYLITLRNISLLGNPRTGIRNILGNAGLMPSEIAKDIIGAPIDKAVARITGERKVFAPTLKSIEALGKGFKRGAKEPFLDWRNKINTSPNTGQFEIGKKQIFKGKPVLEQLERGTNLMLKMGDSPFYQANYDKALYQIMDHYKVKTPTKDMIDYATKVAEEATFINESSVVKGVQTMKSGMGLLGDIAIPYVKTPANILDKTLDYLPTGFVKAAFELGKGSKKLEPLYKSLYTKNKAGLTFDQKKFVDRLSRAILGTGTIAGATALGKLGGLTGAPNKNPTLANIERQAGKLPYAVNTGNGNYVTYDWAQPISTLIATGANLGNEKLPLNQSMLNSAKLIQNQSFLRGLSDMFKGGNFIQGAYDTIVKSPGQFNPTLVKQTTKLMQPYMKETSGEPQINAFGKPVKTMYGNNTVLNTFLNPASTATYNPSKSEKLIIDLANRSGVTTFLPTSQDEVFTQNGKKVTLTPQQLTQFRKNIGNRLDEQYNNLSNSTFMNFSDTNQIKKLTTIKNKIVSNEQKKMLRQVAPNQIKKK